jgi:anti-anti-sigma factor
VTQLAELRVELHDSLLHAHLTGEIDMSNADELREAIAAATPNDALGVILDLTEVIYLDSAGIHLIYRLRDSLGTRAQGLRLAIPRDSLVNDTLRLAGIERGRDILDTVEDARRALLSSQAISSP